TTYPQMQWLRLLLREIPFAMHSPKLLSPLEDDYGTVELEIGQAGLRDLRCGRRNLRLVKLTGSAFKDFARDAYTTLPDVSDRPVFSDPKPAHGMIGLTLTRNARDCGRLAPIQGPLGGGGGTGDVCRVSPAAAAPRPPGPGPLERRSRLGPARRPGHRARLREPHELSRGRAASPLPRRHQRDRDPVPLRVNLFRQQGGAAG